MKKMIILASLVSMATLANAQVGRVISSTPITQTVAVPQQTCSQGYVSEPSYNGGAAVIGAIAGGLIGNAVGGGHRGYYGGYYGRNNGAIALGAVSGALIGSQVNNGGYVNRPVQNCYTQNTYQNNITGYEVVYEMNGGTYTTQTSSPPGRYINVGDNYSNYSPPTYYQPAPVYTPAPVYVPRPVYVAPPVYYAPPPVYYRPYRHHGW